MDRIQIIENKLKGLRELDSGFSIFGSEQHKYKLNNVLSREQIHEIETDNSIFLADDFKEILACLGNGGAGCGYGLERLSLSKINPPYIGTRNLLRKWDDPNRIDCDMIDLNEISGYIKLFDYGCGMETCIIVKGEEKGELIFFDCDGRFEKIGNKNVLDIYEEWLDSSLSILKRVQTKLNELPLGEVIESEWNLKNFSIRRMILSIINADPIKPHHTGNELKDHVERQYEKWKEKNRKPSNPWWRIWRTQ